MRSHGSAKTNVYQRRLLIRRVRHHGWTQRQAAEALGVSVTDRGEVAGPRSDGTGRSLFPAASAAAADPSAARSGHRGAAAHARDRVADQRRVADASVDGHARVGAHRPESREAGRTDRPVQRSNGRTSATCSTSI